MKWRETAARYFKFRKLISFGLLAGILLGMASFADRQHKSLICARVNVNILDQKDYQFISRRSVLASLAARGADDLMGRQVDNINLRYVEGRVQQNSFVKDVTAWFNMKGELNIDLHQRVPVVRVANPLGETYYLDLDGKRMPLSDEYTALVPMATADYNYTPYKKDSVFHAMDSSLHVLAMYMQRDSFAMALSGQILVQPENQFVLIPRLGNFQIYLGDVSDLDDKFLRLKSFYRATLPQVGWDTYKTISLKYRNQIIANR